MLKVSLILFWFTSSVFGASLSPDQLTVEHLTAPDAVDNPNPRLAWILKPTVKRLEAVPRNLSQTAYQVLVASTDELISSKKGDLWDSNKVTSDSTINVKYRGKALEPGQQVFWTVRVWDQHGNVSSYAEASTWGNALSESHWTAKWIGAPAEVRKKALTNLEKEDEELLKSYDGLKPVLYFRKKIRVDPINVKKVMAYATAKGLYKLYFNREGSAPTNQDLEPIMNPGWTDYAKTIQYQAYDLTDFADDMDDKQIIVGAMLTTGWYSGYVGYQKKHSYYGNDEFVLIEMHIEYKNGTKEKFVSDDSWKVTTGPLIYADILHGEVFYENRQFTQWTDPTYNDTHWSKVVTKPIDKSVKLVAEPSLQVSAMDSIRVKKSWKTSSGDWVYDFGVNFAGFVMLALHEFKEKTVIHVKHGEMLHPNRAVYTANLRSARAVDTYVCNGNPSARPKYWFLLPEFSYHGFRYIEISGIKTDISTQLWGVRIGMENMIKGNFSTDSSLVQRLHENIVRSQISNFISVPTDCPQRDERLGWMGDAQLFAPTAMYNGDVAGFYTKWLRDVREAQSKSGAFSDISPRLVDDSDGAPAWGDAGIILTWHMYRMYGDIKIIEDNYQAMESWISYISTNNPTLIWKNKLNNNFGDWLDVNGSTPKELISTAYFAHDANLLSRMAKAIGKTTDANKYEQLFENIAKAFNREFVDKTNGKIGADTQTCYVLALAFGLFSEQLVPKAVQLLVDNIQKHNMHLTTGFVGTAYLLPVLSDNGHSDIAYKLLLQDTYPSWGYTIKNNATTIWERWDGWTKEKGFQNASMNSFNHYALGSVGSWMFQYMAGIDTDLTDVGFKKIIIKPHIGTGVNQVEANYHSVRGNIRSSWKIHNKNFTIAVSIPPSTKATVILPFLKDKWEREIHSGEYEFSVVLN